MKGKNMIGFTRVFYTLQNADGHDLVLTGPNFFLTESIAVEAAQEVTVDYKDTVLVAENTVQVVRAFRAAISATEVTDTSTMAS